MHSYDSCQRIDQLSIYSHFYMSWLAILNMTSFSYTKHTLQFMNSALHFVLGVHPSEQPSGAPLTSEEFVTSFHSALQYSMFRVLLGWMWNLLPQKRYIDTCAKAHRFLDYYINQASGESHEQKSKSLIHALSAQTDDSAFIRSQVIQATMAAQDTTSELLTNALFLLARHPRYWEELRTEFVDTPEDSLSAENLLSSKLIQNIMHESKSQISSTRYGNSLTHLISFAPSPNLPRDWTHRITGHRAPSWGRPPPQPSSVHPEGVNGRHELLRAPPQPRGLRKRRRGIPTRALEPEEAGALVVPGIRRGQSGVLRAAESDGRGLVRTGPTGSGNQQAGE